jgi:hypothetical protein
LVLSYNDFHFSNSFAKDDNIAKLMIILQHAKLSKSDYWKHATMRSVTGVGAPKLLIPVLHGNCRIYILAKQKSCLRGVLRSLDA